MAAGGGRVTLLWGHGLWQDADDRVNGFSLINIWASLIGLNESKKTMKLEEKFAGSYTGWIGGERRGIDMIMLFI